MSWENLCDTLRSLCLCLKGLKFNFFRQNEVMGLVLRPRFVCCRIKVRVLPNYEHG